MAFSFVFTAKAERFHVGKAGKPAVPEDEAQQRSWLVNEFIALDVKEHATVEAPEKDGMFRKRRK